MRIKKIRQSLGAIGKVADSYTTDSNACYNAPYVNSIIESGSDSNGTYIKYKDGTMICTMRYSTSVAISTAWGGMYRSDIITMPNYPVAFTSLSSIQYSTTGSNSALVVNWSAGNLTKPDNVALLRGVSATSQEYIINVTTIGKWK